MSYHASESVEPRRAPDYDNDFANNEQAIKNSQVRKRIDELLEKKKLKELLDDSDDW